jgi:hypothetical protein
MASGNGGTIINLKDAQRIAKFLWAHPMDLGTITPTDLAKIVADARESLDPELESPAFWEHLHKWASSLPPIKTDHPDDPEVEKANTSRAAVGMIACPVIYGPPKRAAAAEVVTAPPAGGWHAVLAALLKQSLDTSGAANGTVSAMLWAMAKSLSDAGSTDPAPESIVALAKRLHPG